MKLVITVDASKREPIIIRSTTPHQGSVAHIRMIPTPIPVKQLKEA